LSPLTRTVVIWNSFLLLVSIKRKLDCHLAGEAAADLDALALAG
jgi:hypothetical protein